MAQLPVANYHAWWDAIEAISALNRQRLRAARKRGRGRTSRRKRTLG